MTNIYWVRHGPTHRDGLIGWTDVGADLSDTQALSRLNAHLPSDGIVISSDLQRCVHTADAIGGSRTRLPHRRDLREFHFGDWEEKTFSQVAQSHPDLSYDYWSNPGDIAPPNGESWNQGATRISATVDALIQEHSGQNIIIVAHFGVILTQLQRAANMHAASALGFKIDNLSVTHLEHLGDAWRIMGVNHNP
ncbi:phosphoglycerate mutase [Amylibacter ulvae]|uniref:Phosphoglycerate mutase n=1 Tax=Paramylibacter ulvae TaxID=1651968 RepID=A0ABQ3D411_9RHOB|nr:histidine phosphatase family protein [Amylibacter ulvae]GHA50243.1 phosphoglycerate mutase [Amylibacter ulvae]